MRTISDSIKLDILKQAQAWVKASDEKLSERALAWEDAEKANQSYLPKADAERRRKANQEEVAFTKVVIPYSYAMLMAAHTYLCSVFLGRDPIFQYEGKTGQGQDQCLKVEAMVKHNVTAGEMEAPLYFWLFDLCMYGVGCVGTTWMDEKIAITTYGKSPVQIDGVQDPVNEVETEQVMMEQGYRGNKLYNVKPKEMICDPSVSFARFQDGDFFGRRIQIADSEFNRKVKAGIYFENAEAGTADQKESGVYGDNPAYTEVGPKVALEMKERKGFKNLWEIYARIVPSDWGLGQNEYPEVWVFTIANGKALVGANPAGWLHNRYPFDVITLEYDAYTLSSRGFNEIGSQVSSVMNWLVNSHMYNVDKAVNNEFLYDPSMLNQADFLDPKPGKRIRIKPAGYGRDIRTFIHQFNQYDMTRTNLQDLKLMEDIYQRVFGINEQMLGVLTQGGRKTATEIRSSSGFALNRLKVLSEFVGKQGFAPLSRKLLKNCMQMYSAEDIFMIVKDVNDKQPQAFSVQDIVGEFDLSPVDGTLPIDRFAQVALYKEILMAAVQLPQIAGRYDVATMFAYIVKLSGIKNLESFQVMSPEQIAKEAQLGNLVVNGGQGGTAEPGYVGNSEGGSGAAPTVAGVGVTG